MNVMMTPEAQAKFRPRRRHRKSRNGCAECKRRRIKCDETKPSCSRCILTMQKCIYASTSPPTHLPAAPEHTRSQSQLSISLPTPSPRSGLSPSPLLFEISLPVSHLSLSPPPQLSPPPTIPIDTTDTALYHHYLQHTSHNLTCNVTDHRALQICLPTLALKSRTVYHSLLALSAACMACDMIYADPPPDVGTVTTILMTGYRHYNLASERLRQLVSRPSAATAEPLLGAPPLLVPFVTSAQQINHWISNRTGSQLQQQPFQNPAQGPGPVQKRLNSTPRDVIVISRGISATIRALAAATSPVTTPTPSHHQFEITTPEALDSMDDYTSIPTSPTLSLPPSHTHPMYHLIKTTSAPAFAKLQSRVDSALYTHPHPHTQTTSPSAGALSACAEAFTILTHLRNGVFPTDPLSPPALPDSMTLMPTLPQVPTWLAKFTARPSTPSSTGHMTRPLLSFLVHAPSAYLDFVLPLLDRRLEGPSHPQNKHSPSPSGGELELDVEQTLALDIYAHWSVLMILVGAESWWIGKLPHITLSGMVVAFGDGFVSRFFTSDSLSVSGNRNGIADAEGEGDGEWWPGSMLRIEREIGRYR
ncbi:hypothetical protein BDW74DRAFT_180836 [Aspergillus multicolor]|uniref:uncharacterized protein n=1 Tax=Aspergillus multicolor TaxID=41759 RepID=UPI003CCD51B3